MKIFTNAVSAFSLLAILILACCHVLEFPCSHVRQSSFIVHKYNNCQSNHIQAQNLQNPLTLFTCTLQDAIHQHLSTSLFRGFVGQCCLCCKARGACLQPCELAFRRPQFYAEVSSILKPKTRIPEVGVLTASLQPVLISELGRFNLFRMHTSVS